MFELRPYLEKLVIKSGLKAPNRLHMLMWHLELGAWLKKNPSSVYLDSKEILFEHVHKTAIGDKPITYLEFGVASGITFKRWVGLNGHPDSRFFGFDTFTGLPEQWKMFTATRPVGAFSTDGKTPDIDDPRVTFLPGLFQETLPEFLSDFSTDNAIVVHCDADLYTSTLFVLTMLNSVLRAGSIVFFDDFTTANHDFRAFQDYTTSYRRSYELLGVAKPSVRKVAIRFTD